MAEVEAETESEAIGVLLGYIGQLEGCILLAAEELREGDPAYGQRELAVFESRIRASMDAAEAATEARNATRH